MSTSDFLLLTEQTIPELKTRARLFRHAPTGAELLSLENDDENKVFGIVFRTPPSDSTGLPHIMEHAVLCGSQKYPVREPFVELMKGSLATFVNAFTFPDKTCYPIASQNLQDFYNLIDVYMDAVLHPLIPVHTLQQEGWHYELEDLDAPLTYKGVVLNEMKGAYSSPEELLGKHCIEALFPGHPYGLDSGGDPRLIPDLTHEQFKAFHATYYHPSNARIFFYGDDDPEARLQRMADYLQGYSAVQVDSAVPLQPRRTQPVQLEFPYDAGEQDADSLAAGGPKAMVAVNWMLNEASDPQLALSLGMLSHILVDTPASPLRKALIDSGLGEDLVGGGLENNLRQAIFSTGLKGVALDPDHPLKDVERVEPLILETLETLTRSGIDPQMVAAAVNTYEFRLRENNTGQFPRGISLMLRALTSWLYGGNPIARLAFEAPLAAIKARLANGERYFETLVRKYLLENPHRVTVVLRPDAELGQRQEAEESARLAQRRAAMSQPELQAVLEDMQTLKHRQETPDSPEALATIPSLRLEDLERQNKLIPLEVLEAGGRPVLYHDLFTNGIVYLDLGFDLHVLAQELLAYVPLFGRALTEIGTQKEDFVRLSQRIGAATGGIYATHLLSAVKDKPLQAASQQAAWLFLRGKATTAQAAELLAILRDVLLTVQLDNRERFRQMVLEEKAGLETALIPAGTRFVNLRLQARFGLAGWLSEQMGGLNYLFFLRQLAEAVERDWPRVLARLEALRQALINRQGLLCNVTLDEANWRAFEPQLASFLESLPSNPPALKTWQPEAFSPHEGWTIPAQVNYVGKGANLYQLGYSFHGSLWVIANYLRATWLWEKVRVQGGAYGGSCAFDHRSGVFSYLSYRDPNLVGTLKNYDGTGAFLRGLELSQAELTKSITGAIGDIDTYLLPDAKGFTSLYRYLTNETDADRQLRREQVLGATLQDFRRFGEVLDGMTGSGAVVVMGSAPAIAAANAEIVHPAERPGWLDVKKVPI